MEKNIAEKTVLYFEKDEYNKRIGSLGYFVRDYVQPLIDELKTIGVNLTKDLIFEIISTPSTLQNYFKDKAKEDSKTLAPVFEKYAEAEYMKLIESGYRLAMSANERMYNSEIEPSFFFDNIVFDENFKASTDPDYLNKLREQHTYYLEDSEYRMAIFEQQKVVIRENEKLRDLIFKGARSTNYDQMVDKQRESGTYVHYAPKVGINPIAYPDAYNDGILEVDDEGNLTLNKEILATRIK